MRTTKAVLACVGLWVALAVITSSAMAGIVSIEGGKTREGQVIVRENVVTINTGDNKLFQFYLSRVEKISQNEDGKALLSKDVVMKQEPKEDAANVSKLSKGMEVEEVEKGDGWTQVKGVRKDEIGWVKSDLLVKEVIFAGEEKPTTEAPVVEAATAEAALEQPEAATGE